METATLKDKFLLNDKDPFRRIIKCKPKALICNGCKSTNTQVWFYCTQDKVMYCFECTNWYDRRSCYGKGDHEDLRIHHVEFS